MSKVPQVKRLLVDEFPDQPWIEPLIQSLNQFMDGVVSNLNNGLTVEDNMAGIVREVELDGNMPLKIAWNLNSKPKSVLVGDWYKTDGSTKDLVLATTADTSSGSNQLQNVASTTGLRAGQLISGTGIPDDTRIIRITGTDVYMSKDATATDTSVALKFKVGEAIQVDWEYNQAGQLQINNVTGIVPSATSKYKLILECKTG